MFSCVRDRLFIGELSFTTVVITHHWLALARSHAIAYLQLSHQVSGSCVIFLACPGPALAASRPGRASPGPVRAAARPPRAQQISDMSIWQRRPADRFPPVTLAPPVRFVCPVTTFGPDLSYFVGPRAYKAKTRGWCDMAPGARLVQQDPIRPDPEPATRPRRSPCPGSRLALPARAASACACTWLRAGIRESSISRTAVRSPFACAGAVVLDRFSGAALA